MMLAPVFPIAPRLPPEVALRAAQPAAVISAIAAAPDRDFADGLAGRAVEALVLRRSDDGRGIVDIGGRAVAVTAQLPAPGTAVQMRFLIPVNPGAAPALPERAGTAAANAAVVPTLLPTPAAAAQTAARSTLVEIGADAASLNRLAEAPVMPLQLGRVPADIARPAEWAAALAGLVQGSGAFYESHLAAWTQGQYPLARLQREPQGAAQLRITARTDGAAQSIAAAAVTATPNAPTMLAEELRPLVREQLHALENRALPVNIEAWPGQRAGLVIAADPDSAHVEHDTGPDAAWTTTLKLALPQLGDLAASLTLRGGSLWLDIKAPSSATAGRLEDQSSALNDALGAAGIRLMRVRIDHGAV